MLSLNGINRKIDGRKWSQLAGPDQAVLSSGQTQSTSVFFKTPGIYKFEVKANDGQYTVSDTSVVNVSNGTNLTLISPKEGDQIPIGSYFKVKWLIDPPEGMVLYFSSNDGKTWNSITGQSIGTNPPFEFTWYIDSSYVESASCRLQIASYLRRGELFENSGKFCIVNSSRIINPQAGQKIDDYITIGNTHVRILDKSEGNLRIFTGKGQILFSGIVKSGSVPIRNLSGGIYIVEFKSLKGIYQKNTLLIN